MRRTLTLASLLIAVVVLVAACSDDSTSESEVAATTTEAFATPTTTKEATDSEPVATTTEATEPESAPTTSEALEPETPATTQPPETTTTTTTTTQAPEPAAASEPFVLVDGITGADLLSWVSQAEADCVRDAVGEPSFEALQGLDLSPGSAVFTPQGLAQAAPVVGCFDRENVGAVGAAVYAAEATARGQDPEMVSCLAEGLRDFPEFTYRQLRLEDPDPSGRLGLETVTRAYECVTIDLFGPIYAQNQQNYAALEIGLGEALAIARDVDPNCVSAQGARMTDNVVEVFVAAGGALNGCFSDEEAAELFLVMAGREASSRGTSLPTEQAECLAGLALRQTDLARASLGLVDVAEQPADELGLVTDLLANPACLGGQVVAFLEDPIFLLLLLGDVTAPAAPSS